MKIFIVSKDGDASDMAEKLVEENHKVTMYTRNRETILPETRVEITRNPTSDMLKAELILVEDFRSGEFVEKAKESKRLILGGGTVATRLSTDSKFGTEALLGCDLTLAKDTTTGIRMEVGGWFSNGEFLKPYFLARKYMKFGTGDIGPELGPMGIVGTYLLKGRIFKETLDKIKVFLKSIEYVGYMGLDLFVNNDSIQVIGWQPGFNYPTMVLLAYLHSSFGNFLAKIARGTLKVTAVQPHKVSIGITRLKLPWLYEKTIKHRPRLLCATGLSIDEAMAGIHKSLNKTLEQDYYYRTDIGLDLQTSLAKLQKWGLI